jgi:hypothetical protein
MSAQLEAKSLSSAKCESVISVFHTTALTKAVPASIAVRRAYIRFVRLGDLKAIYLGGAAPEQARG